MLFSEKTNPTPITQVPNFYSPPWAQEFTIAIFMCTLLEFLYAYTSKHKYLCLFTPFFYTGCSILYLLSTPFLFNSEYILELFPFQYIKYIIILCKNYVVLPLHRFITNSINRYLFLIFCYHKKHYNWKMCACVILHVYKFDKFPEEKPLT